MDNHTNNSKNTAPEFKWIDSIQVAFHPQPKGIIQFIGGFGFGSIPTLCYRELLREFFEQEYTIVVLSYAPLSNHLPVAEKLFRKHKKLREQLPSQAKRLGFGSPVYDDAKNYFWVGHSLGCEYIALLELLSSENQEQVIAKLESLNPFKSSKDAIQNIQRLSLELNSNILPIRDQSSLLIAPCFKPPSIAKLWVRPTEHETWSIIKEHKDEVFNLTALISFDHDNIAGHQSDCSECNQTVELLEKEDCSDVCFLIKYLKLENLKLCAEFSGNHYTPLCLELNHSDFVNAANKFLQRLREKVLIS